MERPFESWRKWNGQPEHQDATPETYCVGAENWFAAFARRKQPATKPVEKPTATPKFWMVLRLSEHGEQPKETLPTYRHATREEALKEAKRLADKELGAQFVVLESQDVVKKTDAAEAAWLLASQYMHFTSDKHEAVARAFFNDGFKAGVKASNCTTGRKGCA